MEITKEQFEKFMNLGFRNRWNLDEDYDLPTAKLSAEDAYHRGDDDRGNAFMDAMQTCFPEFYNE